MNPRIESLEKMLGGPRDGALLRFSLGNEYLKAESRPKPPQPFRPPSTATRTIPPPGRPRQGTPCQWRRGGALAAYEKGIAVADARGDIQAAKEMNVFARRLRKAAEA
jgi:hypothetical protein